MVHVSALSDKLGSNFDLRFAEVLIHFAPVDAEQLTYDLANLNSRGRNVFNQLYEGAKEAAFGYRLYLSVKNITQRINDNPRISHILLLSTPCVREFPIVRNLCGGVRSLAMRFKKLKTDNRYLFAVGFGLFFASSLLELHLSHVHDCSSDHVTVVLLFTAEIENPKGILWRKDTLWRCVKH